MVIWVSPLIVKGFRCDFIPLFSSPEPKNISEASRPILIKFNVNHNWVGGLMALGFGADCIKIVVSMATDRSHRLTMGKTKKNLLL